MFETTLAPAAYKCAADGDSLRVPAWDELVVRLAATRDLRTALYTANSSYSGSFARFAAAQDRDVNGKAVGVNPTGLARGKSDQALIKAAADEAADADREMQ